MRIALVHPFCWPEVRRGAERYLADLAWYLRSTGHDVDVVTGTDGHSSVTVEEGVTVRRRHHVGRHRLGRLGLSPVDGYGLVALPTLLRRRYDVVHALVPSAAVAARLAGHRVVYTLLGHPSPDMFGVRPFDLRLVRTAMRTAYRTTALSVASRDSARFLGGRTPEVLPPGVRLDGFGPRLSPRAGPVRILFASDADEPRKGADWLLRAFAEVLRTEPDAVLQHSGPGSLDRALAGLDTDARALVAPAVERLALGTPEEVAARYRDATVTVLPARQEAFGLVLVESLASGTPVVCAADAGPPEIVSDPGVGVAVPVGDTGALARGLLTAARLAGEAGTAERCAAHAEKWDWQSAVGPRHVALYESVRRHR